MKQQYNLLLADDDEDDCDFFKEALDELLLPTSLVTVNDGVQLMDFLSESGAENLPDILFLDLNMPRKNGLECLTEIKQLEKDGQYLITDLHPVAAILLEEVEIYTEDVPGWLVASENGLTVALDITVTDELRLEGIARDFVNRVQNLRKDSGFEVTDKIKITLQNNNELLASAVTANRDYICQEVQALDLDLVSDLNGTASEIEMDEFLLKVKIEVVA